MIWEFRGALGLSEERSWFEVFSSETGGCSFRGSETRLREGFALVRHHRGWMGLLTPHPRPLSPGRGEGGLVGSIQRHWAYHNRSVLRTLLTASGNFPAIEIDSRNSLLVGPASRGCGFWTSSTITDSIRQRRLRWCLAGKHNQAFPSILTMSRSPVMCCLKQRKGWE